MALREELGLFRGSHHSPHTIIGCPILYVSARRRIGISSMTIPRSPLITRDMLGY